jgi:hypothetical protein
MLNQNFYFSIKNLFFVLLVDSKKKCLENKIKNRKENLKLTLFENYQSKCQHINQNDPLYQ